MEPELSGDASYAASARVNPEPILFPVSVRKFAIMSFVTFGFYDIYWMYRNWWYLKRTQGLKIMPFWRAIFVLFFTYSLLRRIREITAEMRYPVAFSAGWLTVGYLVMLLLGDLPVPYLFVAEFAWICLIPVVQAINDVNGDRVSETELNRSFSAWNIAGVVLGSAFWVLAIAVLFGT
jgi:hypothetical protein